MNVIIALAAVGSAIAAFWAVKNQERVRPIVTLTFSGQIIETEQGNIELSNGTVTARNVGKSPAFPLRVRIERTNGEIETIERFGVTAGGGTDLFGTEVDINSYNGARFTLSYGDVDGRKYESKIRCDTALPDRFAWEA